jgi:hypothetical protein
MGYAARSDSSVQRKSLSHVAVAIYRGRSCNVFGWRYTAMFLQTYVVPVCLCEIGDTSVKIVRLIGSAFFINETGAFLTARHVIDAAQSFAGESQLAIGLAVKRDNGRSETTGFVLISAWESAPDPFDIVIGQVSYSCETVLKVQNIGITEWKEVATFGYPLTALSGPQEAPELNIRCHRGYIQRLTRPGDIHIGQHPNGFELSFPISQGLSGAPLFVHAGDHDVVIGVCVSSYRSEIVEYDHTEVYENGTRFSEKRLKIEEYGFAHDIRALAESWRPALLANKRLSEL